MKEKWRGAAFEVKERSGRRAGFTDLVTFIYRQAQIANDPLFGNIQDNNTPTERRQRQSADSKILSTTRKRSSSFATAVTLAGEDKTQYSPSKGSGAANPLNAFQKPC